MKQITLTKGFVALVDDRDYEFLNRYTWCVSIQNARNIYALTYIEGKNVLMHKLILQAFRHDVDHIDGNGLNNCRSNLRLATKSQNQYNKRKQSKLSSSIYKGVCYCKNRQIKKKWMASIRNDMGKSEHLGYFLTELDAAKAYDAAARLYFGEFAKTNF